MAQIDMPKVGEDYVFTFGKFKGRTFASVFNENAGYILWCEENIGWFSLDDDLRDRVETRAEHHKEIRSIQNAYIRSYGRQGDSHNWGGLSDDDFS